MKAHISVDDVIYSFMELCEKEPESAFDIDFYKHLKEMNIRYGALFTLYAFENYGEKFFIDFVPKKYMQEFAESGFIKIGFHGTFFPSDFETFAKKCDRLYAAFPEKIRAETIRLHKYEGDADKLRYMKKYKADTFLCREDESRRFNDFPPSYIFSEEQEKTLSLKPFSINGFNYVKTSIRLEFYDIKQLEKILTEYVSSDETDSILAVYTHERIYSDYKTYMEYICKFISEQKNISFSF